MKILTEIQNRINKETRSPSDLYTELRQLGAQMVITNVIGRAQVVTFCSSLIKLYELLSPKEETNN